MYHVVQNNLFHEFGFKTLIEALEECGADYTITKVIPYAHELEEDINLPEGNIMVWGSTTLGGIAVDKGWKPGVFKNDKFDMQYLTKRFGLHMLNADAQFCTFGELDFEGEKFIRPVHDSKSFSGMVVAREKVTQWQEQVLGISDGYTTLRLDTPVMYAEPKNIDLEARFFIVDNRVVTGSSYRTIGRQCMYQRVDTSNPVFYPMVEFVKDMLAVDYSNETDTYEANYAEPICEAYVMDIGLVDGEYKVVEINSLNSAGFYACDMRAVVRALEVLYV